MDMKSLAYFITVVETGSISAAARKLHIAQPPLSLRMRSLEEDMGILLMERGSRHIQLTDAGKALYARAKVMLDFAEMTKKEMNWMKNGSSGSLRIGISSSCTLLLSELVVPFQKDYPLIHFELFEKNTYEQLELLESNIIELAIVRTPFDSLTRYNFLTSPAQPMIAVLTKEHLLNFENQNVETSFLSLNNLKHKPLITYRRWQPLLTRLFQQNGIELSFYCVCDDARTCLSWAEAGLGIALVPDSICTSLPFNLLAFPLKESSLQTEICIIWKKSTGVSAPAKNFLSFAKQSFFMAPVCNPLF